MTLFSDLRAAVRLYRRRPAIPVVAMVFLSCGMGVAAGLFAVADAALWRSLPLPEADRVVWVQSLDRGTPGATSPGLYSAWAARSRTLVELGALRPVQATLRDAGSSERLDGAHATAGVFRALGVVPRIGRTLNKDDERAGAEPVLLLTHRLWQARFGGDPSVIGRQVLLDGRGRRIVGVLELNADQLPLGGDWFTPLAFGPDALSAAGPRYLQVVGRLAPSLDAGAAGRELSAVAESVGAAGGDGAMLSALVRPLGEAFSDAASRLLLPLLTMALLVLLIAAGNSANLLMAQLHTRRSELAVRAALGAGRGRLARQLLAESLVVTVPAGVAGVLLAQWTTAALIALLPAGLPRVQMAAVDGRTVAFVGGLVSLVTVVLGILPAIRHSRVSLSSGVMGAARGVVGGDDRLRRGFVIAQIALAMTLGTAGVLMWQTTRALMEAPRGYASDGVWTAALRLSAGDFPGPADLDAAITRILTTVGGLPGVTNTAVASRVPLAGGAPGSDVALASDPFTPGTDRQARIRIISPGFFRAVGVSILEGRDVEARDGNGAAPVVLVNEALAARLTPGRSPVGQPVKFAVRDFSQAAPTWEVIGVVGNARDRGPRATTEPEIYIAVGQTPAGVFDWIGRQLLLVARAAPGVAVAPQTLRQAVNAADPRVPAFDVLSLDERLRQHLSLERLLAVLLVPIAVAGTLLAGFGVFALVMHMVTSRRREIALRMVLGATPASIVYETGRLGLGLAAAGALVGTGGALVAERLLAASTFESHALDPAVLPIVVGALALTTLVAVWLPARRAARHDPAEVLRSE